MNRRSYLLIMVLAMVALALAACPAGAPAGEGGSADAPAPVADVVPEQKNPDTLILAMTGDPETLDPSWTYETAGSSVETNIYEGMVWFNKDRTDEYVPVLATDWTVNESGDQWVFNVRDGVNFHDGSGFDAADVVYSLGRVLDPDSDSPARSAVKMITNVEALDDMTVQISLDTPFADMLDADTFLDGLNNAL